MGNKVYRRLDVEDRMVIQACLHNRMKLELDEKALLNKVRNGATNMKKIAATLGDDFLEERQLIQEEYRTQILELKEAIETAIANSEDPSDLEDQLEALREEMVDALQTLIAEYRQQTTQARQNWQNEANIRKGGSSSSQGSSQHTSTTTTGA